MKILLAAPRGFCAGVNMAVRSLELALSHFGSPVYVYHEIVHNQFVVKTDRKSTRLNSSHEWISRMPSSS